MAFSRHEEEQEESKPLISRELAEAMKVFAETIVRGDPDVAKEKEEQKRRNKLYKDGVVRDEQARERREAAAKDACNHTKENGKWSTGGQVMGDGKILIICTHCRRCWKVPVPDNERRLIESGDISLAEVKPPDSKFIYGERIPVAVGA